MSLTFTDLILLDDIILFIGTKPVEYSDISYEDFSYEIISIYVDISDIYDKVILKNKIK